MVVDKIFVGERDRDDEARNLWSNQNKGNQSNSYQLKSSLDFSFTSAVEVKILLPSQKEIACGHQEH
jgi:hypothetical protein